MPYFFCLIHLGRTEIFVSFDILSLFCYKCYPFNFCCLLRWQSVYSKYLITWLKMVKSLPRGFGWAESSWVWDSFSSSPQDTDCILCPWEHLVLANTIFCFVWNWAELSPQSQDFYLAVSLWAVPFPRVCLLSKMFKQLSLMMLNPSLKRPISLAVSDWEGSLIKHIQTGKYFYSLTSFVVYLAFQDLFLHQIDAKVAVLSCSERHSEYRVWLRSVHMKCL